VKPSIAPLLVQLQAYKKKYYLNSLIRGLLISFGLLITAYLAINTIEFFGNLDTIFRGILFYSFLAVVGYVGVALLGIPVFHLLNINKSLSDAEAAKQVGKHFPEVKDKLLNTLQLSTLNTTENTLLAAAIEQKTKELSVVPFVRAVDYASNNKYLRYVLPPLGVAIILALIVPQFFTESTARIVNYEKVYLPKAPFTFHLLNKTMQGYMGEPFVLQLALEGSAMPEQVYVLRNGRRQMMQKKGSNFEFEIGSLQKSEELSFEGAGFKSGVYDLEVLSRPALLGFSVELQYPSYLGKANEKLSNTGNFTVPVGTKAIWKMQSSAADSLSLTTIDNKRTFECAVSRSGASSIELRLMKSTGYEISLSNQYGKNREPIRYQIDVIPDEFPNISVEQYRDSALFNFVTLGGSVNDDYGITKLELLYRIRDSKTDSDKVPYKSVRIPQQAGQSNQSFLYNWQLDSLAVKPGQVLEYFMQAWDNDGVNGPKSSKSRLFAFAFPDQKQLDAQENAVAEQTKSDLDKQVNKAEKLRSEAEKLRDKLRAKRQISFQDKKALEELLKKREELQKEIEQMQKQNKLLNEKQNRFSQQDEKLKEKAEELKKLMDDLLDPETKKLYEDLQKLMQDKAPSPEELQKILNEIEKKEENLSKELDRNLELFKQLQFEQKLDKAINKLDKLAEKQEKLAEKSENPDKLSKEEKDNAQKKADSTAKELGQKEKELGDKEASQEALKQQQEKLNEETKELMKDMKELEVLNKKLEDPASMPDSDEDEKDVKEDQKDAKESLDKKDNKKASKSQKKAAKKMKEMKEKMAKAAMEMEADENAEDAATLRQILENLLTLSYDEEDLMKSFKGINQLDPRYITLGQKQLKLKDDAKMIEDSLLALAKRQVKIKSFVTREVGEMKSYMEESLDGIKQRRPDVASTKQQFAMTSMNNLALMLTDALKEMQDAQAEAQMKMKGKGKGKGKSKGKGEPGKGKPSLSKMQKELNEKIGELKKSGKGGKEMSEELAKLAAQQQALRRALNEQMGKSPGGGKPGEGKIGEGKAGEGAGGTGGKNGNEGENGSQKGEKGKNGSGNEINKQLQQQMEQTEQDLVNKNLTQELLNRQKEILTRLLESENAAREREQDPKREAKSAKELRPPVPPSFEKFLKEKEKQVELLKSLPPNLTPFYKKENNRYFEGLGKTI
jgi:hypothetical protein